MASITIRRNAARAISNLKNRAPMARAMESNMSSRKDDVTVPLNVYRPLKSSAASPVRFMSTSRGRSMRSKVEKRMLRETGRSQRELRRAIKLRKKLMTDDERLIFNLRRAKKKAALLQQKLKKYELPDLPAPCHDPELFTAEQFQAYKKIGLRNKNYLTVGVRGVFGGVVQNMHMHWKFHETVQICCDNFPREKIKEMATMLARLSGGVVINVHNMKTIIMFRGRNYRQPKNLIPFNTLTKRKALFKARFEQALESQKLNIKKYETQLRRKGISPEDPVAMASIQRVAATFFRAIDEQKGTPYVFGPDQPPFGQAAEIKEEPKDTPSDDSDQEELDRFIANIEASAEKQWEEEEEAEKEESMRIRYWNKEDMNNWKNRSRSRNESEARDEDEENGQVRHRRGHGAERRNADMKKWDSGSEISDESEDNEWESETENDLSEDDSGVESPDEFPQKFENRRLEINRGPRQANRRNEGFSRMNGNSVGEVASSGPEDEEDDLWEVEEDSDQDQNSTYNFHSGSDTDVAVDDSDEHPMASSKRTKRDIDEDWESE